MFVFQLCRPVAPLPPQYYSCFKALLLRGPARTPEGPPRVDESGVDGVAGVAEVAGVAGVAAGRGEGGRGGGECLKQLWWGLFRI